MAINPEQQYPDKITPASADYPFGQARNVTTPGDGTGTPLEQAWVNDLFGWQQALLTEAGITPSGVPDTARNSQHLQAMQLLFADAADLSEILNRLDDLENKVYEDISVNQLLWVEQHFNSPAEVANWKGYGVWERALKGRVAVGFSDIVADPADFKTFGATYGSTTHALTAAENGPHTHPLKLSALKVSHDDSREDDYTVDANGIASNGYVATSGTGTPHNIMQPSKTLDCWKRIA